MQWLHCRRAQRGSGNLTAARVAADLYAATSTSVVSAASPAVTSLSRFSSEASDEVAGVASGKKRWRRRDWDPRFLRADVDLFLRAGPSTSPRSA